MLPDAAQKCKGSSPPLLTIELPSAPLIPTCSLSGSTVTRLGSQLNRIFALCHAERVAKGIRWSVSLSAMSPWTVERKDTEACIRVI
mmetsp:Transcript_20775/g.51900  ORF Transcript_20775/g.51900 Transcript_20775/m.51900 type:complete len:87 (+) Transcript_20775:3757-4017(+)